MGCIQTQEQENPQNNAHWREGTTMMDDDIDTPKEPQNGDDIQTNWSPAQSNSMAYACNGKPSVFNNELSGVVSPIMHAKVARTASSFFAKTPGTLNNLEESMDNDIRDHLGNKLCDVEVDIPTTPIVQERKTKKNQKSVLRNHDQSFLNKLKAISTFRIDLYKGTETENHESSKSSLDTSGGVSNTDNSGDDQSPTTSSQYRRTITVDGHKYRSKYKGGIEIIELPVTKLKKFTEVVQLYKQLIYNINIKRHVTERIDDNEFDVTNKGNDDKFHNNFDDNKGIDTKNDDDNHNDNIMINIDTNKFHVTTDTHGFMDLKQISLDTDPQIKIHVTTTIDNDIQNMTFHIDADMDVETFIDYIKTDVFKWWWQDKEIFMYICNDDGSFNDNANPLSNDIILKRLNKKYFYLKTNE
mmetsp:Transcript_38085/g.47190  ORF Transcript_38085/g.47190 Transcript_38085/m.47190 type:complete len:413 (-) Transcript_38085:81-1319(-)